MDNRALPRPLKVRKINFWVEKSPFVFVQQNVLIPKTKDENMTVSTQNLIFLTSSGLRGALFSIKIRPVNSFKNVYENSIHIQNHSIKQYISTQLSEWVSKNLGPLVLCTV